MPTKKFLALTIGPIYKTLQKAKNTQSLWGASYLISYLMKQISNELKKNYSDEFIIPYIKDKKLFEPQNGAGLFPDRLIIRNGNIKDLENAINTAIQKLIDAQAVKAINEEILEQNDLYRKTITTTNETELKTYLFKYFLFGAIEIEIENGKNIMDECGKQLSILELQSPYYNEEKTDLLYFLIQNISKTKLINDAFGTNKNRFPSISEISTTEFEKKYPEEYKTAVGTLLYETGKNFKIIKKGEKIEDDEDKLFATLKQHVLQKEDVFHRYHKYITIVKADGDNMGKAITAIYEKEAGKVAEVDKAILKFNLDAVNKIDAYGGKPIYLGGDDLLFFAPVCSEGETIFKLVKNLSDAYNSTVGQIFKDLQIKDLATPTLSFGISITYYKYPMNEALALVDNLLTEAKKKLKNAVSFRVMKHSGHYFGTRFPQDKSYYSTAFHGILSTTDLKDKDAFLSSVMYRIREMEYLIKVILKDENAYERLLNFFDNHFNEGVHSTKKVFLDKVAGFIYQTHLETKSNLELTLQTVYSTLRLVQFIHQKDTENDD